MKEKSNKKGLRFRDHYSTCLLVVVYRSLKAQETVFHEKASCNLVQMPNDIRFLSFFFCENENLDSRSIDRSIDQSGRNFDFIATIYIDHTYHSTLSMLLFSNLSNFRLILLFPSKYTREWYDLTFLFFLSLFCFFFFYWYEADNPDATQTIFTVKFQVKCLF